MRVYAEAALRLRRATLGGLLCLGACAEAPRQPYVVTYATAANVMLEFDPADMTPNDLRAVASRECRSQGRDYAELTRTGPGRVRHWAWTYWCNGPPSELHGDPVPPPGPPHPHRGESAAPDAAGGHSGT